MAQQIIEDTLKDVGTFMADFTKSYVMTMVQKKLDDKIQEVVETIFPPEIAQKLLGGDDEKNDLEEKADVPPIAAGLSCVGYRSAIGPDKAEHRYYDFACFSIKPKDSVICKVTKRHLHLQNFSQQLRQEVPETPNTPFPGKKRFGKKTDVYYRQRFDTMREYFTSVTVVDKVFSSDKFLMFFNLKFDEKRANMLDIFMSSLQSLCEDQNINWQEAVDTANRLGFTLDEAEMLKVVAVAKVGEIATNKLRDAIVANTPGFLPPMIVNKFIAKAELQLAQGISSAVDAGWKAAGETFSKITETLNDALDKAADPLGELFKKAADPVGEVVKKQFAKAQSALEKLNANDGLDRKVTADRFPPLKAFLEEFDKGAVTAQNKLLVSIDTLYECYKYINFLRYNLGNPQWGEWIPFINDIQETHARLTIALSDTGYILSRAGVEAFMPLFKYVDEAADKFDEKTHEEHLRLAVRKGGKNLARQYFYLPDTLRRATWTCGSDTTKIVTDLAEKTIFELANLLGKVAHKWKPTSSADVRKTFIEAAHKPLNKFINWALQSWVSAIREATQEQICDVFEKATASTIGEICQLLDDLCSKLPPPLGDNVKPGTLIKSILRKMVKNASVIALREIAKPTETRLYDVTVVQVEFADESEVYRYRWPPRIRKAEELGDGDEEPEIEQPKPATETTTTETTEEAANPGGDQPQE